MSRQMYKITYKKYACKDCGYITDIDTNHWGECYSLGGYNQCPKCPRYLPPDQKWNDECGHDVLILKPTAWVCQEVQPTPKSVLSINQLVKRK